MSPERLQKSVKALPFQYWDNVGSVLDIIHQRWQWLESGKMSERKEPRKVVIMVMGGSVTMDVACINNPVFFTKPLRILRNP